MNRILVSTLLSSSLLFTAAAYASPLDGNVAATPRRVSTGVTPPQLLNSLNIAFSDPRAGLTFRPDTRVSVAFVVDETGTPRNIQVVNGIGPFWNARITEAISGLRYRPGTIDNQPVSIAMNLDINIK